MSNNITKIRLSKAHELFKKPAGKLEPCDLTTASFIPRGMTKAFKNNRYVVMMYEKTFVRENIFATKLLIQKHDNTPIINHWKELQSIKNELFGDEVTAIEYYPKTSKLLDTHNIYWLWIYQDGIIPEYNANQ